MWPALTLATALPLSTLIGGQIMASRRAARQRLRDSGERFRRRAWLFSDWCWEQDSRLPFITLSPGLEAKADIT